MLEKKRLKKDDAIEYRVYTEKNQDSLLTDKLLDLFVQAFINKELDTLANQRSNRNILDKDGENNGWKE